jgi:PAS domain S-box-containing protein
MIYEQVPTGIAVANPNGHFEECNPAFSQVVGYSEAELRDINFMSLIHPDDVEENLEALENLMTGAVRHLEIVNRYIHKDGRPVWVRKLVSTLIGSDGKPAHLLALVTNIDDLKKAEAELRQEQQHISLLIDHAPAALAMFDKEMRYLKVSKRWMSDFCVGDRDLTGLSHYDVFPEISETWREIHRRALQGEVLRNQEDLFLRADGSQQWLRWEVRPWFSATNEIGGIIIFAEDITRQKRAEQRVAESEARYRAIVDTAADSIVVFDGLGTIHGMNPATQAIFGFAPDELMGQKIERLLATKASSGGDPGLEIDEVPDHCQIMGVGREVIGRRKDGSLFPVDLAVTSWSDPSGARYCAATMRDISERKRAEEQLANARRLEALGQLAGGVAHDFNNLLTVISGNLELAEQQIDDPRTRGLIARALSAAQSGNMFNRRLLSLSGRRKVEGKPLDLSTRVEGVISLLARTLGEHIVLEHRLGHSLWETCADAGEIDSVVLNLASNARDAMPDGGAIRITTGNVALGPGAPTLPADAKAGDYVCLSVSDTGEGMSPRILSQAMDPFFSTKGQGFGTGLGLSSVAAFARQSGGFVTIDSAEGQGTTVSIFLPRVPPAAIKAQSSGNEGVPMGDGETILVVEDDKFVREVTLKRVEALGYVVVEARSGVEAKEILKVDPSISLVLSDILMPGGVSGDELARWIATQKPGVQIVLASGYSGRRSGAAARALPDVPVLEKPYTRDRLARALRTGLERAANGLKPHP